jgi:hypothetical protein
MASSQDGGAPTGTIFFVHWLRVVEIDSAGRKYHFVDEQADFTGQSK